VLASRFRNCVLSEVTHSSGDRKHHSKVIRLCRQHAEVSTKLS